MSIDLLQDCLEQARESARKGGFPAGALVVKDGMVISYGQSLGALINDPTSHGEVAAIRGACSKLKTNSLVGCILYSTMEPCQMCKSAAYWAGIKEIVFIIGKNAVSSDFYDKDDLLIKQDDTLGAEVLKLLK